MHQRGLATHAQALLHWQEERRRHTPPPPPLSLLERARGAGSTAARFPACHSPDPGRAPPVTVGGGTREASPDQLPPDIGISPATHRHARWETRRPAAHWGVDPTTTPPLPHSSALGVLLLARPDGVHNGTGGVGSRHSRVVVAEAVGGGAGERPVMPLDILSGANDRQQAPPASLAGAAGGAIESVGGEVMEAVPAYRDRLSAVVVPEQRFR